MAMLRLRPSFDRIARPYHWLEQLTHGDLLWDARITHLDALSHASKILILGEGDGRFLEQLLRRKPSCAVDVVESSAEMVRLARSRISGLEAAVNVRFFETDASNHQPQEKYDAIVSLFFLDCFEQPELARIVTRFAQALKPGGLWLYVDFCRSESKPTTLASVRNWLTVELLYWAFNKLTDIRASQLDDPRQDFLRLGLELLNTQRRSKDLVTSELWRMRSNSHFLARRRVRATPT